MYEPPITASEARSEGFELDDYETEEVEIWADNEAAFDIFRRVGTRWRYPPMGGIPIGLDWAAIYPLMDRAKNVDWDDLHDAMVIMEDEAMATMREFQKKDGE